MTNNVKGFRQSPKPTAVELGKEIESLSKQVANLIQMANTNNDRIQKMHGALRGVAETLECKTDAVLLLLKEKGTTDADIDKAILKARENMLREREVIQDRMDKVQDTDLPIKSDDIAIIDFVGTIEGKVFQGGQAEGFRFKVGAKQVIADLEASMIGKKVGDEYTTPVKFPSDYARADLANKDAEFKVKIVKVKTPVVMKLVEDQPSV
jgi:hypothetical protein